MPVKRSINKWDMWALLVFLSAVLLLSALMGGYGGLRDTREERITIIKAREKFQMIK